MKNNRLQYKKMHSSYSKNSDQHSIWQNLKKHKHPERSGLTYSNEFTFLVAILLSAQSRDDFVNTQTIKLFEFADTAEKMYDFGLYNISECVKKIGLWRTKATNIYKLSKKIIDLKSSNLNEWYEKLAIKYNYDEEAMKLYGKIISKEGVPSFKAGLIELPGIGVKSANVFLNITYNAPVFPVDTHVIRVANRLGISNTKKPLQIECDLKEIVPEEYARIACMLIVWHGRKICKAINPLCGECHLRDFCEYYKNIIRIL